MHKLTKFIAVAMAATLMIGSTVTAFAEEPVTSVDTTGEGSSEGHVEKKTTDITLPTVASGTTPFAYIMDPERLIAETAHERYANTVWPEDDEDTGVYFNQGKKGGDDDDKDFIMYGKDSISTTITNKSSHALNITVKAEAISADTDIPLVAEADLEEAEEASLYLGLVVGSETPGAITKDEAAEITVSVAGTPANYKVAWNGAEGKKYYEYRQYTLEEWQALEGNSEKEQEDFDATWKTTSFNLEGAVTEALNITKDTTAPEVKVTWSWADPDAEPEAYVSTDKVSASSSSVTLSLPDGVSVSSVTLYKASAPTTAIALASGNHYTITDSSMNFVDTMLTAWGAGSTIKITYSDSHEDTLTIQ